MYIFFKNVYLKSHTYIKISSQTLFFQIWFSKRIFLVKIESALKTDLSPNI